jgi:hypothetical protein
MGDWIVALVVVVVAVMTSLYLGRNRASRKAVMAPPLPRPPESTEALERQIAEFEAAGLKLNPGITLAGLLHSYPASEYAGDPYRLLLFMYGSEVEQEPWGRRICDAVLNFDYECIDGEGSYVRIAEDFARLAGVRDLLNDLRDDADLARETGTLTYSARGELRTVPFRIDNDWADPKAVQAILSDMQHLAGDGRTFWGSDNGQSVILVFVDKPTSTRLNKLTMDLLEAQLKP